MIKLLLYLNCRIPILIPLDLTCLNATTSQGCHKTIWGHLIWMVWWLKAEESRRQISPLPHTDPVHPIASPVHFAYRQLIQWIGLDMWGQTHAAIQEKDMQKSTVFWWLHRRINIDIYRYRSIDGSMWTRERERQRERERAWLDCILQKPDMDPDMDMQPTVVSVIETTWLSQNFTNQVTGHLPSVEADMYYGQNMVCELWSSHHHYGFHTMEYVNPI